MKSLYILSATALLLASCGEFANQPGSLPPLLPASAEQAEDGNTPPIGTEEIPAPAPRPASLEAIELPSEAVPEPEPQKLVEAVVTDAPKISGGTGEQCLVNGAFSNDGAFIAPGTKGTIEKDGNKVIFFTGTTKHDLTGLDYVLGDC